MYQEFCKARMKLTKLCSVEPLSESTNDWANEIVNYPQVPEMLALEKATPSKQQPAQRLITRHETEIFYGLVTPGTSPVKAIGNRVCPHIPSYHVLLTFSFFHR